MNYSEKTNEELEVLVNNHDFDATKELAERYLYGKDGNATNYTRAYHLLHKGEKQGFSWAYVGLGEMYRKGIRFVQNEKIAREYYEKAGVPYPDDGRDEHIYEPEENEVPKPDDSPRSVTIVEEAELQKKYDQAEQLRADEEYERADKVCKDAIAIIDDVIAGSFAYKGNTSVADYKADFNWILAFLSFNRQDCEASEYYIAKDGVVNRHPWALYLRTIIHRIRGANSDALEKDFNDLIRVQSYNNMQDSEKSDIFAMIADLLNEGYGGQSGLRKENAREYFQKASSLGNSYAQSMLDAD